MSHDYGIEKIVPLFCFVLKVGKGWGKKENKSNARQSIDSR